MTRHVVFFSSGIGSWAAAKRVAAEHGTDNLTLLFADTLIEDSDNYRFLEESARNVGGKLVRVADGRTPFEVFRDKRLLGSSRIAPCSHILKQEQCLKWLKENDPEHEAALYIGIDWYKIHRLPAIQRNWQPWEIKAPMTEPPYLDKSQVLEWARAEGLRPPRLYDYGLPHANCGGGCVIAGQAHWRHVYRVLPEVFERWEAEENKMREFLGRDVAMLSREKNGVKTPLPLSQLRREIEESDRHLDLFDWDVFDWGGCGCFVDS